MSERYQVLKYRMTPGSGERYAVTQGDDWEGHVPCYCPSLEDANKIAAALNAAPQAEKARKIIERAEKAIMRVASESDVSVGAGTEPGCWWCEAPAGEDHASDCLGSKLLADIAAYKEG